jgi:hypothetical protein
LLQAAKNEAATAKQVAVPLRKMVMRGSTLASSVFPLLRYLAQIGVIPGP